MGARMCRRILDAGYPVISLDHDKAAMQPLLDAGAKAAATAKEVADSAEIVIVSLPTPPIVQAVAAEVAQGSKVGRRGRIHLFPDAGGPGRILVAGQTHILVEGKLRL